MECRTASLDPLSTLMTTKTLPGQVSLRKVRVSDLLTFYEHQRDAESVRIAAFPAREREAHMLHWHKIMADTSTTLRAVLSDGDVAGNIVSWDGTDGREVGYWIGREYWGRGIATRALRLFLKELSARPLFAHVARHNIGSRRVLEKCGFVVTGVAGVLQEPGAEPVAEFILRLD
jgi:RimJ/RimL family protein N-acetyltransferase